MRDSFSVGHLAPSERSSRYDVKYRRVTLRLARLLADYKERSDVLSVERRTPPPIGEGVLLLSLLLYAVTLIVTVIVALV